MKQFKILITILFVGIRLQTYADNKVDDLAHTFMNKNQVQGMSIAVINKNKTIIYNYGYANEVKKIPVGSDTIYRIASFSKTYTATLAAIAAAEGKLNLDAPFNTYFPDLKNKHNLDKITSAMLLAHVSSFPFDFKPNPATYSDVVKDLSQFVPPNPPGSQYGYSNAGIGTMAYVVQNVYGKTYDKILAEKISKPLNLNSTYLNLPIDKEKDVAVGHEKDNTIRPYDRSIDVWYGAAALKSTISDMAKFLNAQINYTNLNDKTLSKAILTVHQTRYCFANKVACEQLAWQAHIISELSGSASDSFSSVDSSGGYIFIPQKIVQNIDFAKNKIFIDKSCGGYGMSGYMLYLPEEKIGVVILLNKLVGEQRIRLGRDIIIQSLENNG